MNHRWLVPPGVVWRGWWRRCPVEAKPGRPGRVYYLPDRGNGGHESFQLAADAKWMSRRGIGHPEDRRRRAVNSSQTTTLAALPESAAKPNPNLVRGKDKSKRTCPLRKSTGSASAQIRGEWHFGTHLLASEFRQAKDPFCQPRQSHCWQTDRKPFTSPCQRRLVRALSRPSSRQTESTSLKTKSNLGERTSPGDGLREGKWPS